MAKKEIICDKCDSEFIIKYNKDDVAREPTYCSFCGDIFKVESDELDFSRDDFDDMELDYDPDEEDE